MEERWKGGRERTPIHWLAPHVPETLGVGRDWSQEQEPGAQSRNPGANYLSITNSLSRSALVGNWSWEPESPGTLM